MCLLGCLWIFQNNIGISLCVLLCIIHTAHFFKDLKSVCVCVCQTPPFGDAIESDDRTIGNDAALFCQVKNQST